MKKFFIARKSYIFALVFDFILLFDFNSSKKLIIPKKIATND